MASESALILLNTPEGQKLLEETRSQGRWYQQSLHKIFRKQVGKSNCGIQSGALVMGASHFNTLQHTGPVDDDVIDALPFTEKKMYDYQHTKDVVVDESHVTDKGITMDELLAILRGFTQQVKVTPYFAADSSVDEFRRVAKETLSNGDSSRAVIVNYHMETLGQGMPYGHHSPLVAYHEATDRFLIMDTWHETVEPWACAEDLYRAMLEVDGDSNKCRGFLVVDCTPGREAETAL